MGEDVSDKDRQTADAEVLGRMARSHILAAATTYRRAAYASATALLILALMASGGLQGAVSLGWGKLNPAHAAILFNTIAAGLTYLTMYHVFRALRCVADPAINATSIPAFSRAADLSEDSSSIYIVESGFVRLLVSLFQLGVSFLCVLALSVLVTGDPELAATPTDAQIPLLLGYLAATGLPHALIALSVLLQIFD